MAARGNLVTLALLAVVAAALAITASSASDVEPLQEANVTVDVEYLIRLESLAHWMYIAGEDLDSIMAQYADMAVLYWVGGPLTGVYHGVEEIRGVWERFFNGNEDIFVRATNVRLIQLDEGFYIVVADVKVEVTRVATGDRIVIDLTYLLLYRDGTKIVEEWWIIDGVESA